MRAGGAVLPGEFIRGFLKSAIDAMLCKTDQGILFNSTTQGLRPFVGVGRGGGRLSS